jgi:hypothetical protein
LSSGSGRAKVAAFAPARRHRVDCTQDDTMDLNHPTTAARAASRTGCTSTRPGLLRGCLLAALAGVIAALVTAQAQPPGPTDAEVARKLSVPVETVRRVKARYGLGNAELARLTPAELRRLLAPAGTVLARDDPEGRARYLRRRQETNGKPPPPDARLKALRQLQDLRSKLPPGAHVAGLPAGPKVDPHRLAFREAGLKQGQAPDRWLSLGPDFVGGRTRALLFHTDPQGKHTLFAGAVAGGVWKYSEEGHAWSPVDDFLANLAVTCLAQDGANTLYAGTGEGLYLVGAVFGAGIFRSTDGGASWEKQPIPGSERFYFTNRLAVSKDGNTLLVAGGRAGEGWALFRSTDPEKKTWAPVRKGFFGDVKFDPTDPLKAVAGGSYYRDQDHWVLDQAGKGYYSTDGGESWTPAEFEGLDKLQRGRVELAYALKDPKFVYAAVQVGAGDNGPWSSELWFSDNGGKSYKRRACKDSETGKPAYWLGQEYANGSRDSQGDYANTVWANDDQLVVVGGLDLWRSDDGGETLRRISQRRAWSWDAERTWGLPHPETSVHADQHVIIAPPDFSKDQNPAVYVGCDGGIFLTEDIKGAGADTPRHTAGWKPRNGGYQTLQFYRAATHPQSSLVLGGAQDNSTFLGGFVGFQPNSEGTGRWAIKSWSRVSIAGDGGYCAIDPHDLTTMYVEAPYLQLLRLSHKKHPRTGNVADLEDPLSGQAYVDRTGPKDELADKPAKKPFLIEDAGGRASFIAPFLLDPNDAKSETLLAGGWRLWRTRDAKTEVTADKGPTWQPIKDGELVTGQDGKKYPTVISAIAVTRDNPGVIWVGDDYGQVFKTAEGTLDKPTWTRVGASSLPTGRGCSCVVLDPRHPGRAYVTYEGWSGKNVWRTNDDGQTWDPLPIQSAAPGSQPLVAPVNTLTIHPDDSDWLYVGTEVGVFGRDERTQSWSPTNEGPANCRVNDLVWIDHWLVAATHARGMFAIELVPVKR